MQIEGDGDIIPYVISGVSASSYNLVFAKNLPNNNYRIHTTFGGRPVYWKTGSDASVNYTEGDVNILRNLTVSGNLTVDGTQLIVNTETIKLEDHNIEIAANAGYDTISDAGISWGTGIAGGDSPVSLTYSNGQGFNFAGGNVGVGTTNPGASLEIKGHSEPFAIYDTSDEKKLRVYTAGNGTVLALTEGENDIIRLDGRVSTPNSSYFNGGDVGIGTTNPGVKLDVVGVGRFNVPAGGSSIISYSLGAATDRNQPVFALMTDETSNQDRVRFDSDGNSWFNGGNVGIGTTNPGAKLDVDGSVKSAFLVVNDNNMISSTEDAEQFFHISGFRISTISYNGTSIGLPSIVAHANYAAFVVGGFQKMLNKGWVGEVSLDAIANNLNFGTSVIIQTSNDGVTWSDQAAATTNRRLVYTNSTPYTIGNYLRVLLVSNSGTANASQSQCRFSNLKITGIDGSLRDFYYNKNLIIDNNGNVGIGTTNPSAKLVIEGVTNNQSQLKITNQNVGRTVVLSANADEPACPFVGSSTNDSFAIYTTNSAKMLINPAGNVGIGATNPINGKLEVLGGSSGAAKTEHVDIAITQDANLTASKVQLRSGVTSGSNPYFAILTRNNNGIATEPGAIKERMRITSAGNVGIGATNPLATLAVQDSSHGGSIQIGSSSGEGQYQYINLANNWQIGKNVSTANAIGQAGSLYIYNIDQSKTNLCITSDGNVGIGTTNPVSAHDRDSVLVVGGGSSFESSGITLGTGSSYANGPYEILLQLLMIA